MFFKLKINRRGFTLIELLVVVAIVGVLSSVVLASLNTARTKGQDTRRKADLMNIRTALEMYYSTCGTYIVAQNCTGTAYGSGGIGFFNFSGYAGSAGSVAQGLVDNGVAGGLIIDPAGSINGNTSYMISADQGHYTLWTTILSPTAADTATLNTCYFSGYDNYLSGTYPGSHNYCISN